jgi:AbrB family looped-hinge helix DNA binding protein
MKSTLSSKGQVTIPIEIRTALGAKPGDQIEFVKQDNEFVLRVARDPDNPFLEWVGRFPLNTQDAVSWVRDLRGEQ